MTDMIEIWTDGACSGNPGPGGWGAVIRTNGVDTELHGGEPATTNNRMELMAAIAALEALRLPCQVTLCSDSKYVVDAMTQGRDLGLWGEPRVNVLQLNLALDTQFGAVH